MGAIWPRRQNGNFDFADELADGLAPALDSGEIGVDGFDPDGSGLSLASATKRLMSVCSPTIEVKTPRLSRCRASLAKQPSTALAQEHQVRVKWKVVRAKHDRSVSRAVCGVGMAGRVILSRRREDSEPQRTISGLPLKQRTRKSFALICRRTLSW
jgi:hypothetical protein